MESATELEELISEARSEAVDDPSMAARIAAAIEMAARYRDSVAAGNWMKSMAELASISHMGVGGDRLKAWCEATSQELQVAAKESSLDFEIYRDVIVSATVPQDLDELIDLLGSTASMGAANQYRGSMAPELQFVVQWQDYLSLLAKSDQQGAARVMQSLAAASPTNPFGVPRSLLLKRAHGWSENDQVRSNAETPEELLSGVEDLKDLPSIVPELLKLANRSEFTQYRSTAQALEKVNNLKVQHDEGLTIAIRLRDIPSDPSGRALPLWLRLIRLTLPRRLGVEGEFELEEEETIRSFLDRITLDAIELEDYALALRAVEERYQLLGSSTTYSTSSDIDAGALKELQKAENYLKAYQYSMAVKSYMTCLQSGSSIIPIERIRTALLKLEEEQEEAYLIGLGFALIDPTRSSRYPSSYFRNLSLPRRNPPRGEKSSSGTEKETMDISPSENESPNEDLKSDNIER
ncbi:MAG: hypothetical protein AAGD22_15160 [Verrucomicrobiota bacterium]